MQTLIERRMLSISFGLPQWAVHVVRCARTCMKVDTVHGSSVDGVCVPLDRFLQTLRTFL
jgi:hypothetical protein